MLASIYISVSAVEINNRLLEYWYMVLYIFKMNDIFFNHFMNTLQKLLYTCYRCTVRCMSLLLLFHPVCLGSSECNLSDRNRRFVLRNAFNFLAPERIEKETARQVTRALSASLPPSLPEGETVISQEELTLPTQDRFCCVHLVFMPGLKII